MKSRFSHSPILLWLKPVRFFRQRAERRGWRSPKAVSYALQYTDSAWQTRIVSRLVSAFALLAVALSLAGIQAVNSFFVARRLNEFGIRAARTDPLTALRSE
jgi:hypothetical protein